MWGAGLGVSATRNDRVGVSATCSVRVDVSATCSDRMGVRVGVSATPSDRLLSVLSCRSLLCQELLGSRCAQPQPSSLVLPGAVAGPSLTS